MQRHKTRIKFLERSEVSIIIASTDVPMQKALMHTLFSTGLRVSECLSLRREDFDDSVETKELSIVGKGGWQRVVFFSPDALAALRSYLNTRTDKDTRLFPITKRTAERIVHRAADRAGLEATPHTFRHSLATHLLRSGANMRVVQEMLGHRAISSTQVYAGCTNKDLLEAHKKFL
jgi:site-specific recombinase XerD